MASSISDTKKRFKCFGTGSSSVDNISCKVSASNITPLHAPMNLMDLPPEILALIHNAVVDDEALTFTVACAGPNNDCIQDMANARNPSWNHDWVPGLRLVSVAFKELISPIIAKHVGLRIDQLIDETASGYLVRHKQSTVVVSRLCPEYIAAGLTRMGFYDQCSQDLALPVSQLDISGCPKLRRIYLGDYDPAFLLSKTAISLHYLDRRTDQVEGYRHLISQLDNQNAAPYPESMVSNPRLTSILRLALLHEFEPLFADLTSTRNWWKRWRSDFLA